MIQRLLTLTRHVILEEVRRVEEEVDVDPEAISVEKHGRIGRVCIHYVLGVRKSICWVSQ